MQPSVGLDHDRQCLSVSNPNFVALLHIIQPVRQVRSIDRHLSILPIPSSESDRFLVGIDVEDLDDLLDLAPRNACRHVANGSGSRLALGGRSGALRIGVNPSQLVAGPPGST
jgi:hypothetical protein